MNTQQDFPLIKLVVDKYFDFRDEIGGNHYITEFIPAAMINFKKENNDDYTYWVAIESTFSEQDTIQLSEYFGSPLPSAFIYFLRQRHFIEFQPAGNVSFFTVLPGDLTSQFKEIIDTQYSNLLERNYLPFAHFADTGVLCFDANVKTEGNDYPIILLDHEDDFDTPQDYANNFMEMFNDLNAELDEFIKNNRENRIQK
jgi:hypothetical protein